MGMIDPKTLQFFANLAKGIADTTLEHSDKARINAALDEANEKLDRLVASPLREAVHYFRAGEYDKARERAISAISTDDMAALGHLILALSDLALNARTDEALTHLAAVTRLNPFLIPDSIWASADPGLIRAISSGSQLSVVASYPSRAPWPLTIGGTNFFKERHSFGETAALPQVRYQPGNGEVRDVIVRKACLAVDPFTANLQYLAYQFRDRHISVVDLLSGEYCTGAEVQFPFAGTGRLLMATPAAIVALIAQHGSVRIQLSDPRSGVILRSYAPRVFNDLYFPDAMAETGDGVTWTPPGYCAQGYARSNYTFPGLPRDEKARRVTAGEARHYANLKGRDYYIVSESAHVEDVYRLGSARFVISNDFFVREQGGGPDGFPTLSTWAQVRRG
jgi:hypothetical protein